MGVRISITLPAELIARLDRVSTNRSALLEKTALAFLAHGEQERNRKDIAIIEHNARRLNLEATDLLDYQYIP